MSIILDFGGHPEYAVRLGLCSHLWFGGHLWFGTPYSKWSSAKLCYEKFFSEKFSLVNFLENMELTFFNYSFEIHRGVGLKWYKQKNKQWGLRLISYIWSSQYIWSVLTIVWPFQSRSCEIISIYITCHLGVVVE